MELLARPGVGRAAVATGLAALTLLSASFADGTKRPALPPAAAAALWDAALVARNEGRPKDGLAAARRLLDTYPREARYLELQALAQKELRDDRGEAATWEQYLRWSPTPAEACPRLGQAYERLKDADAALDAHKRCLDLSPSDADLKLYYARALQGRGREEDASKQYESILAAAPDYGDAALQLGRRRLDEGDLTGAASLIEPVVQRNPNAPDPLLFGALVDLARGDAARAEERLRRAIAKAPRYADLYRVLARACDARSDAACASWARETAKELDAGRAPRAEPARIP